MKNIFVMALLLSITALFACSSNKPVASSLTTTTAPEKKTYKVVSNTNLSDSLPAIRVNGNAGLQAKKQGIKTSKKSDSKPGTPDF